MRPLAFVAPSAEGLASDANMQWKALGRYEHVVGRQGNKGVRRGHCERSLGLRYTPRYSQRSAPVVYRFRPTWSRPSNQTLSFSDIRFAKDGRSDVETMH